MRRDEFSSSDNNDFQSVTHNALVGYLALKTHSAYPRIVPLNFVAIEKIIYFHGARSGEKYDLLRDKPLISFSIDVPYSLIPSYFTSKKLATPTTHFFKSVHIRGQGLVVSDLSEKATAMNHMMQKYQPEGGYLKIAPKEKIYKNALMEVVVYKIEPFEITMKMKFGQNLTQSKLNTVIKALRDRGTKMDLETIREMQIRNHLSV